MEAIKGNYLALGEHNLNDQHHSSCESEDRVILQHCLIEAKSVEKLLLVVIEPPHHAPLPSRIASQRRDH